MPSSLIPRMKRIHYWAQLRPNVSTVTARCHDSIQRKYWSKLKAPQKIALMDILLSVLEFAASYNSYSNLRMRMHQIPPKRCLKGCALQMARYSGGILESCMYPLITKFVCCKQVILHNGPRHLLLFARLKFPIAISAINWIECVDPMS